MAERARIELEVRAPHETESPTREPVRSVSKTDASTAAPNMHADTPIWHDVCCCEPEPRWQALADEHDAAKDG